MLALPISTVSILEHYFMTCAHKKSDFSIDSIEFGSSTKSHIPPKILCVLVLMTVLTW